LATKGILHKEQLGSYCQSYLLISRLKAIQCIFVLQLENAVKKEKTKHEQELSTLENKLKENFVMVCAMCSFSSVIECGNDWFTITVFFTKG